LHTRCCVHINGHTCTPIRTRAHLTQHVRPGAALCMNICRCCCRRCSSWWTCRSGPCGWSRLRPRCPTRRTSRTRCCSSSGACACVGVGVQASHAASRTRCCSSSGACACLGVGVQASHASSKQEGLRCQAHGIAWPLFMCRHIRSAWDHMAIWHPGGGRDVANGALEQGVLDCLVPRCASPNAPRGGLVPTISQYFF